MFRSHTSARFPFGQLKLDAPVEFHRDESICRHHDNPWDEEEQQQQRHIPERDIFGISEIKNSVPNENQQVFFFCYY